MTETPSVYLPILQQELLPERRAVPLGNQADGGADGVLGISVLPTQREGPDQEVTKREIT